jgi:uncharacterized protein DUF6292
MMELDFDDSVARGLHRYVRLVCQALGLRGTSSYIQSDEPLSAYVALDGRFGGFPDHDVALLWEESRGWSAAVETSGGEDLRVVATLGGDVLPPPDTVASWTHDLFQRDLVPEGNRVERPVLANPDTMRKRLAAYLGHDAPVRLLPLASAR